MTPTGSSKERRARSKLLDAVSDDPSTVKSQNSVGGLMSGSTQSNIE